MSSGHSHATGGHGHGHEHGHGHGHGHGNESAIAIAALLTGSFMLAEVAGGLISGSLALLADAGHMLTDFASLVLAWLAFRFARRPATWRQTYGFDRLSVLAAFINGLSLFVIAGWITYEALHRLLEPGEVLGGVMLWVAVAGLVVNILAFRVLSKGGGENLNVRAAALHVAGDLLGSVAAIERAPWYAYKKALSNTSVGSSGVPERRVRHRSFQMEVNLYAGSEAPRAARRLSVGGRPAVPLGSVLATAWNMRGRDLFE